MLATAIVSSVDEAAEAKREAKKAYQREWYLANKDRYEGYRERLDPEKDRARRKRYREANAEACRARVKAVREQRRGVICESKNAPCADCGGEYPPWVMDFDHVRGTKSFNIAQKGALSTEQALRAEIAKCEVVCANCHRDRTEMRARADAR